MQLSWVNAVEWCSFVSRVRQNVLREIGCNRITRELLTDEVEKALPGHYESFVAYHGCRPIDVDDFYRKGLLLHSDSTLAECRALVLELSRVPSDAVDAAIANIDRPVDYQRAYVVLDRRAFIKKAPHYLIYGSEFTMSILAELARMGFENFQYKLKTRGTPTLFTCHVSFRLLKAFSLREIAETLVHYAMNWHYHGVKNPPVLDHTVVLHVDLPSKCIVSHTHPNDLVDWHVGGSYCHW